MKTLHYILALMVGVPLIASAQSPYPNQQQGPVLPAALIAPSGNPPTGNAWTPRALLVDPTTGALKVSDATATAANTAIGTTTDTPSTTVQDATARTVVSLLKGIQNYLRDLAGNLAVADGAAISGNGALIAGSDGTNKQTIISDASGRLMSVGAAADGAAVAGNPVLIGGSDGTNAHAITTDANGNQIIVGDIASGATDSGNPVKVGGKNNTTLPTLTDGQRGDLQLDTRGAIYTVLKTPNGTNTAVVSSSFGDGITNNLGTLSTGAYGQSFNGTNWDRLRNNTSTVLLASAARTTTQTSADQTNYNGRAIHVIWDITAHGGGTGATLSIQGKDANNIYYTLLTGTAETTTGTKVYKIGPGITTAANAAASDFLPRTFRVVVTAGDATSITYSLAYNLIN